jgi:hypothetical protein
MNYDDQLIDSLVKIMKQNWMLILELNTLKTVRNYR